MKKQVVTQNESEYNENVEVELSLDGVQKPIGVADYQLLLPKEQLQKVLTDEVRAYENSKAKSIRNEDENT